MFCSKCGTQLKNEAKFCHSCGALIVASEPKTVNIEPESTAAQQIESMPPIPDVTVQSQQPVIPPQTPQEPKYTLCPPVPPVPPVYEQAKAEPQEKNLVFSILSLVFGIVGIVYSYIGLLVSPAALIFGIIARKKSKSGMALAGIILGAVGTAFASILLITEIFIGESPLDYFDFYDYGMYF